MESYNRFVSQKPFTNLGRGEQVNFGIEFEAGILGGSVETYVKNRNDMFSPKMWVHLLVTDQL